MQQSQTYPRHSTGRAERAFELTLVLHPSGGKRRNAMTKRTNVAIALPVSTPVLALRPIAGWRDQAERLLAHAEPVSRIAPYVSLAIIYAWFGGMKFTAYEAEGLVPLVQNSPLLSWFYTLLSVRGFSTFLGFVELSIGLLIVLRLVNPIFSVAGGLLSTGLFATTISFMISTPGVVVPELGFPAISVAPGQFLLKDVGLLAASFWVFVDSLKTVVRG
jgi:uncharacterized membrane protein YkgB